MHPSWFIMNSSDSSEASKSVGNQSPAPSTFATRQAHQFDEGQQKASNNLGLIALEEHWGNTHVVEEEMKQQQHELSSAAGGQSILNDDVPMTLQASK